MRKLKKKWMYLHRIVIDNIRRIIMVLLQLNCFVRLLGGITASQMLLVVGIGCWVRCGGNAIVGEQKTFHFVGG